MSKIEILSQQSEVSMADDWYSIAGPEHFWIRWRYEFFKKHFKPLLKPEARILEIGCGNGLFKDQIETSGFTVDGCDLNLYALNLAKDGKGKLLYYNIYDQRPELKERYDLIILADVIEHINDDAGFIKTAMYHLKPGGCILINVPCFSHLYSNYDKEAGHIRRYTLRTLSAVTKNCGLNTLKILMWGHLLYPVALIRKVFLKFIPKEKIIESGFKPPIPIINNIFSNYSLMETKIGSKVFPGSSIMGLFKKQ